MEFFCYHRDRAGSAPMRTALVEQHWAYMDAFEQELIARGPTLTADREAATGSVHIVDLPDAAAARVFALDEPNYQAGVYRDVLIRRWHNRLGRTMWEFPPGDSETDRYLVLGLGTARPSGGAIPDGEPSRRDDLIAYGPLLSDDGQSWLGTAVLAQVPDEAAARSLLTPEDYTEIEVHPWDYGGRPE